MNSKLALALVAAVALGAIFLVMDAKKDLKMIDDYQTPSLVQDNNMETGEAEPAEVGDNTDTMPVTTPPIDPAPVVGESAPTPAAEPAIETAPTADVSGTLNELDSLFDEDYDDSSLDSDFSGSEINDFSNSLTL